MATVRLNRGRWVADFRDQHGRRRIEVPEGTFESKKLEKRAADELLSRRLAEVRACNYTPDRQRMTFEQLANLWLASKVQIRDTTLDDYKITLRCYLLPYFGQRRAETMSRLDLERFRAELAAGVPDVIKDARDRALKELRAEDPKARLKPLKPGPRTVNKCLTVLTSVFGYGAEHGVVLKNVAKGIDKLPTDEGEDRVLEQNVLTPNELSLVLSKATDPWRIPIMLAIYTGMRQGEILGLQWGDIDWNRKTVEVRRNLSRKRVFSQPKTTTSRRTVELPDIVIAELKRWRLACPKAPEGRDAPDLVCPSTRGLMMQASALLTHGLHPALRRAGIRQVRFHDLRHSFASNLLAAGEDIVRVSRALGHSNVHITLTTYAHAVPRERHGAPDRMAQLLSGKGGNRLETGGGSEGTSETAGAA